MEFSIETVTPAMAERWLEYRRPNRRISERVVKEYAEDMRHGRWELTSKGLSFNEDGQLDDGQHRLAAVIRANVPVRFSVIRNAPNAQFAKIDRGRSRTLGNVLGLEGIQNSSLVVSAVRNVLRYELYPDKVWQGLTTTITDGMITEYFNEFGMDTASNEVAGRARILTRSTWLAVQHIVIKHSPSADRWPEFAEGTLSGANLALGDPRLGLRNWQHAPWGSGQSYVLGGIVAWNHWINGRNVHRIVAARGMLPMPKPQ